MADDAFVPEIACPGVRASSSVPGGTDHHPSGSGLGRQVVGGGSPSRAGREESAGGDTVARGPFGWLLGRRQRTVFCVVVGLVAERARCNGGICTSDDVRNVQ